jgi:dipeptidyl aminopeptidase/acylaminoacyl peptidase
MRRWILAGIVLVGLVALVGYGIGSYQLYEKISAVAAHCDERASGGPRFQENTPAGWTLANPEDVDARWPESSRTLDSTPYAMPDYEDVSVPSHDPAVGLLSGWWVPGRTTASPAVVVVHGLGSCKRDHVVLLHAGMLHRAGFGVLLIDIRDMGDSPHQDGRFAGGSQEYLDVLGARDWLVQTQGLPASRVGIMGNSEGAATVIIAAAQDPTVAATWEDSGYGDVHEMIADEIAYQGLPDALNVLVPGGLLIAKLAGIDPLAPQPIDAVAAIGTRPFAIVHGLRDQHIPVRHATEMAAVVARSVPGYQPWIVPCAFHVEEAFCAPAEYEARLASFFGAALGAP